VTVTGQRPHEFAGKGQAVRESTLRELRGGGNLCRFQKAGTAPVFTRGPDVAALLEAQPTRGARWVSCLWAEELALGEEFKQVVGDRDVVRAGAARARDHVGDVDQQGDGARGGAFITV
jgi:hypothetical protein